MIVELSHLDVISLDNEAVFFFLVWFLYNLW